MLQLDPRWQQTAHSLLQHSFQADDPHVRERFLALHFLACGLSETAEKLGRATSPSGCGASMPTGVCSPAGVADRVNVSLSPNSTRSEKGSAIPLVQSGSKRGAGRLNGSPTMCSALSECAFTRRLPVVTSISWALSVRAPVIGQGRCAAATSFRRGVSRDGEKTLGP